MDKKFEKLITTVKGRKAHKWSGRDSDLEIVRRAEAAFTAQWSCSGKPLGSGFAVFDLNVSGVFFSSSEFDDFLTSLNLYKWVADLLMEIMLW